MLNLTIDQHRWVLQQERQRLAQGLAEVLAVQWPALGQQLGPRVQPFVEAALQQAGLHGLPLHRHAARLLNLWCLWGPSFEDKPGFEWAAEVLRDTRRHPAIKIQQLVLQTRALLQRPGSSVSADAFDRADVAMVDATRLPHHMPWIEQPVDAAEPRVACDMTAFELGLGDQSWRQEYLVTGMGAGVTATLAAFQAPPQNFRVDRPREPGQTLNLAALAYPVAEGVKAMLQVRCEVDEGCHARTHPRIELQQASGTELFEGERQLRWPLHRPPAPVPQPGAAPAGMLAEPLPTPLLVAADTCGLRLLGAPMGRQEATVSVWPAEQWLAEFRARPQPEWDWPSPSEPAVVPPPRVSLACDGRPVPVPAWEEAWGRLAPALKTGVDRWWRDLQRNAVLANPRLHLVPGLMHGTSLWTWGAREVVDVQGSSGFLRVQADGTWVACGTDLSLSGEFSHEGAVGRLRLRSVGEARLDVRVLREQALPALAQALGAVKVSWRHPFEVELDALSTPNLKTLSLDAGQPFGALCGEAGLRPRADGQGHEWYCTLKLEPMALNYTVWDPMTGMQRCTRPLWPATPLLDWSAG